MKPTNARFSDDFLLKIPKTDIHCHLDGSIRLDTLIDLAQQQGVTLPAYTAEGLRKLVFKDKYTNLEDYLKCFAISGSILTNQNALSRVAYELAVDQYSLGVRYFEVRFAPQLNAIPGKLSVEEG
jgi:adenosine deaminase